jgi:hypothetical protein
LDSRLRREGSALYARLEMYSTFLQSILDGIKRSVPYS